jgi:hypothetical protein
MNELELSDEDHGDLSESARNRSGSEDERKLRRRLQNRECARNLRQRRANYIRALEQQVEQLTREKAELTEALQRLTVATAPVSAPTAAAGSFDVDSMFDMELVSSVSEHSSSLHTSKEEVDIQSSSQDWSLFYKSW